MSSRGISSVGRAIGSQSIGQGFESPILQEKQKPSIRAAFCFDDEEKGLFQLTNYKINFTPFPTPGHDVIESF